ncbi:MAG: YqcC family protein [Pseudomonadales bacterium]
MSQEQNLHTEVAGALIDVEAELRQRALWQSRQPAPEALASTQPFCFDTLSLPQWLQFVFLPQMYRLIEEDQRLPDACGIAPMAEEYFRGTALVHGDLIPALRRLDRLLCGDEGPRA